MSDLILSPVLEPLRIKDGIRAAKKYLSKKLLPVPSFFEKLFTVSLVLF